MARSLIALLLMVRCTGATDPAGQILHDLASGPAAQMRALKAIKGTEIYWKNPAIQQATIQLLNNMTKDPEWGEKAEYDKYEFLYEQAMDTVQVIARETNNREAWMALGIANYNAGSPYGDWLINQANALPVLIALSSHPNPAVRSRMMELFGYIIAACRSDNPKLAACRQETRLLQIIHEHATDREVSPWVMEALGICGTEADIPFLESMRMKLRNPDDPLHSVDWEVDRAEKAIRQRAAKQSNKSAPTKPPPQL